MSQVARLLGDLLRGWIVVFRTIGAGVAVLAAAGLVSLGIVYPLWWLAIRHRGVYSYVSFALLAATAVWFIFSSLLRARHQRGYARLQISKRRRFVRTAGIVAVPILVYVTAVLYARNVIVAAIPLSLGTAAAIGFLVTSGHRRTQ